MSDVSSPTHPVQLLQPHQHVPRLAPVRRPQDTGELQLIDYPGRPAVPDAHAALQQRRRAQLVLDADFRRLAEQRIALTRPPSLVPRLACFLPRLRLLDRGDLLDDVPF